MVTISRELIRRLWKKYFRKVDHQCVEFTDPDEVNFSDSRMEEGMISELEHILLKPEEYSAKEIKNILEQAKSQFKNIPGPIKVDDMMHIYNDEGLPMLYQFHLQRSGYDSDAVQNALFSAIAYAVKDKIDYTPHLFNATGDLMDDFPSAILPANNTLKISPVILKTYHINFGVVPHHKGANRFLYVDRKITVEQNDIGGTEKHFELTTGKPNEIRFDKDVNGNGEYTIKVTPFGLFKKGVKIQNFGPQELPIHFRHNESKGAQGWYLKTWQDKGHLKE